MKMIIAGRQVDSSDLKTVDVVNPATMQILDTVPAATAEDVEAAVQAAQRGFVQWSKWPMYRRIEVIEKYTQLLLKHKEELARLLVRELGKPISQARGEVDTAVERALAFVQAARFCGGDSYMPGNCAGTDTNMIFTVREPYGIVLCVIPYNFPLSTMVSKLVPALLMGNSAIIKPSTETPLSGIYATQLLLDAGIVPEAVQIITGSGSKIGNLLTGDPRVAAVTMTGSSSVGQSIAVSSAKNFQHMVLELGGNDACIILPDADMDRAVNEAKTRIINCGQLCNGTKRYLIHSSMKDEFIARLIDFLKTQKASDPELDETVLGPLVSRNAACTVEEQVKRNVEQGCKVLYGGHRFNETYFEPTVLDVPQTADVAHDMEIFGPVWSVITYETVDEAIEIANASIYGLNAGVIGKDSATLMRIVKALKVGTCVINGSSCYSSPYSPFGGYKASGVGRRSAMDSLNEMSQVKTIVLKNMY